MIREYRLKIDWLLLFLILLPTFYIFGKDLREVQTNFFQISLIVLIGILHINKYVGLFLLWATFQFLFFERIPIASLHLQNLFFAALLYHMVAIYCKRDHIKKYLWAIYGILIFNMLWIPLQMADIDPIWSMANKENQAVMSEFPSWFSLPAFLGNYAAVSIPLSLFLAWPLAIFGIAGLWFSKSTFSVVAAYLAILFFYWFRKRLVFWILLVVLGIGVVFCIATDLPGGQFNRRLKIWDLITRKAVHKQFFGYGIGSYSNKYTFLEGTPSHDVRMVSTRIQMLDFAHDQAAKRGDKELVDFIKDIATKKKNTNLFQIAKKFQTHDMDIEIWGQAHNEYLQVFFENGIFGVIIIMLYLIDIGKRFLRYGTKNTSTYALMASFIAILIVAFGHFPFHVARLAGPFIVIMAFLDLALLQHKRTEEDYI